MKAFCFVVTLPEQNATGILSRNLDAAKKRHTKMSLDFSTNYINEVYLYICICVIDLFFSFNHFTYSLLTVKSLLFFSFPLKVGKEQLTKAWRWRGGRVRKTQSFKV